MDKIYEAYALTKLAKKLNQSRIISDHRDHKNRLRRPEVWRFATSSSMPICGPTFSTLCSFVTSKKSPYCATPDHYRNWNLTPSGKKIVKEILVSRLREKIPWSSSSLFIHMHSQLDPWKITQPFWWLCKPPFLTSRNLLGQNLNFGQITETAGQIFSSAQSLLDTARTLGTPMAAIMSFIAANSDIMTALGIITQLEARTQYDPRFRDSIPESIEGRSWLL